MDRQPGAVRAFGQQPCDIEEIGAEVMAPGRNAVGLVNHQLHQRQVRQVGAEPRVAEPLGRDIQQPKLAGPRRLQRLLLAGRVHTRNQGRRLGHPGYLAELLHLVSDQGNQGRDDHRQPRADQGGQLVGAALARAGRQEGQDVVAGQDRAHGGVLARPEGVVSPEGLLDGQEPRAGDRLEVGLGDESAGELLLGQDAGQVGDRRRGQVGRVERDPHPLGDPPEQLGARLVADRRAGQRSEHLVAVG